jgi:hypothetical protein
VPGLEHRLHVVWWEWMMQKGKGEEDALLPHGGGACVTHVTEWFEARFYLVPLHIITQWLHPWIPYQIRT